jgi:hypothetical protein
MNAASNDIENASPRLDLPALGEAISFWFAISSPLTGLIVGLVGAWFYNRLTG